MCSEQRGPVALRGDESELFARYHVRLERAVARRTAIRACLVEEACSFAWMQFCLHQPERERAYPWLVVVARNEAIRMARSGERAAPLDPPAPPGIGRPTLSLVECAPDPIETHVGRELRERAREALVAVAELPERQRRPMALKVAGLTYQEIQRELGWSYSQVNRHLTRARRRLREVA